MTQPNDSQGLEARGLVRRFVPGGPPAVDGVSFTAPRGAITTLLGPSGSGKTTVLRLVAGLEALDAGSLVVDGADWTRLPVRRRKVGLVFQRYALFAHMTVRANIAFGLKAHGVARHETAERVRELLELVQLGELAERYPSQLSGGQQQRVAFARALAPHPSLLLLDEPFGALDASVRHELRSWLRQLHERTGITTILVTHDQEEALEISQQVVVLHQGRVEQIGTPSDIYNRPATQFVASFVGGASRLRGRIEGGRATMGELSVDAPAGATDGATVLAFVRPHDVTLRRPSDRTPMALATVLRLQRIGGFVKVELRLPSGEPLTVQLPAPEVEAIGLHEGGAVVVDLRAAKLFLQDYVI